MKTIYIEFSDGTTGMIQSKSEQTLPDGAKKMTKARYESVQVRNQKAAIKLLDDQQKQRGSKVKKVLAKYPELEGLI